MIAIQNNDKCFSTALNGHNPFNTDGQERTELPVELARTALDFNIVKRPSYDAGGRPIPHHYHLVKDTDSSFIPCVTVGEKFKPIQHHDVFDYIVNDVMPEVPEMELEMAGTIHGGGVGLIAAKFGNTFSMPGDESPSMLRMFVSNPSNGSGSMTMGFTNVRVVCQNTLLAATREAKADGWRIHHTQNANALVQEAVHTIRSQAVAAIEMKARAERLARIGIDATTFERCLDAVYPAHRLPEGPGKTRMMNLREEVSRQFECGETAQTMSADTAWKAFNSFTFPIFNPERLSSRKDRAEIAYSGMTGATADRVGGIFAAVESVVA